MPYTNASIVVQDLTYTESRNGLLGTITYKNTATAGSEVASFSGNNLTVTIQSGVSTAAQILTAIQNRFDATIFTVTVSGTASNAQVSCVSAPFTGGAAIATATLALTSFLTLTAVTAGTAGNSVTFKFTGGATAGSEVVTVAGNNITCQIADGVSTWKQVRAAYNAVGAATALATLNAVDSLQVAYVGSFSVATSLAGGAAAASPKVTVQDLTLTFTATGTSGNDSTLTYTTGATAGAEVVTVSGHAVSVQIANGVSTATQINTALGAAGAFTAIMSSTVSGTGTNVQKTVNALATTGGSGAGAEGYYKDQAATALTASYVAFNWLFDSAMFVLTNDEAVGSTKLVFGSYDGINQHFKLNPGEVLTIDQKPSFCGVFLKYSGAAPNYRLQVSGR